MKKQRLLTLSLIFNALAVIGFLGIAFMVRDKIAQRFVREKGHPTIVMYGNSITAQGKWVELLRRTDVLNSGLPGQATYHFLKLIDEQVIDYHPKICFVKGGINDVTLGVAQDQIQAHYKAILEILVENKIIPVVTLTVYRQHDAYAKREVDKLNSFLVSYCEQHHITYIDLNQYICNSTGLRAEYAADNTHLNYKAYKIWAREISRVLKEKNI